MFQYRRNHVQNFVHLGFALFCFWCFTVNHVVAQEASYYYYYHGQPIPLYEVPNKLAVRFKTHTSQQEKLALIQREGLTLLRED